MTARTFAQPFARSRGWLTAVPSIGLIPVLAAGVAGAAILAVGIGAVGIEPPQVIGILLRQIGVELPGVTWTVQQESVLLAIRLPRVILAGLIGAGLAICGAVLQGIFRNPLADPSIIGVSSGAAVGAVASIVIGAGAAGSPWLVGPAFAGGVVATLAVYALARHNGRTEVVTLVLTGVALTAICSAVIGFMTFLANDNQLRSIVFWTLGGLGGATWPAVLAVLPFTVIGLLVIPAFARSLNLLVLGEREARHLGVHTERVRLVLIVLTALVTGAGVAVAGMVGFVGLVVPHIIRLIAGPDHRLLLPASALLGSALLIGADLASRTLRAPAELPLGVLTAMVGGPFFLWLLQRTRRQQGGWG